MKLSIREKLGYSLGDTASHFVWDLVNFWLIFYYTDVLHISAGWASAIAILGTIMDAVMDPVVGIWADRTNTRWGKFRPFLLFGCVPFALFAFLAFFGPALQGNALIAYILPMFIGLRIVYAIVNIPYSSLGAVMTDDSIERTGLNSYRFVAANIGQLIVSGFALYIVYYLGSQMTGMDYSIMSDDAARKAFTNKALVDETYIIGFRYLVGIFSCIGIILFLITFATTKERVAPPKRQYNDSAVDIVYLYKNCLRQMHIIENVMAFFVYVILVDVIAGVAHYAKFAFEIKYSFQIMLLAVICMIILWVASLFIAKFIVKRYGVKLYYLAYDVKYLFKNRPWVVLTLVGIISFIMFAIQNISAGYYFKYYLDAESKSQIFNIIGTIALIVAIPMTKPLVKKFGAKQLYIVCSLLSGFFFCLLFFAGKNFVLINVFNCLGKISYAPAISLLWTMLADAADYGEWKFNHRTTGLCLSAAVFAQKIGWSIGAAIFGAIMSAVHFDGGKAITVTQGNAEIMNTIHWMFGIVPGVLYASCAIVLAFYTLDTRTMAQMKAELEERRK